MTVNSVAAGQNVVQPQGAEKPCKKEEKKTLVFGQVIGPQVILFEKLPVWMVLPIGLMTKIKYVRTAKMTENWALAKRWKVLEKA